MRTYSHEKWRGEANTYHLLCLQAWPTHGILPYYPSSPGQEFVGDGEKVENT